MIVADSVSAFDVANDEEYDQSLAQLEAGDYGSPAASAEKNIQEWMLA